MVSLTQFLFLGPIGAWEVFLLLTVILIFFGAKKIPELARGLGKGIREFKDASDGVKREIHRNINAMDLDKEEAEELADGAIIKGATKGEAEDEEKGGAKKPRRRVTTAKK